MKLNYYNKSFNRGKPWIIEALWVLISGLLFSSFIPGSLWRVILLRAFGASIGCGVVIKPFVKVKFPWKLKINDYVWIGEEVWIDNLDNISIGSDVCISQGVYICTGSHDFKSESFNLITKPIIIKDKSWLCAQSILLPGITVNEGSVLSAGSIAKDSLDEWCIYRGNPAIFIKKRYS